MNPRPTQKYNNLTKLGRLTTPFGGSTNQEATHPGIDISNKMGTPIPSTTDGVVVGADYGHVNGENNYGNSIKIKDHQGNVHQYSHLMGGNVVPGQQVKRGQPVATMGNSGASYSASGKGDGVHLDLRIVDLYGRYKNPLTYLRK